MEWIPENDANIQEYRRKSKERAALAHCGNVDNLWITGGHRGARRARLGLASGLKWYINHSPGNHLSGKNEHLTTLRASGFTEEEAELYTKDVR